MSPSSLTSQDVFDFQRNFQENGFRVPENKAVQAYANLMNDHNISPIDRAQEPIMAYLEVSAEKSGVIAWAKILVAPVNTVRVNYVEITDFAGQTLTAILAGEMIITRDRIVCFYNSKSVDSKHINEATDIDLSRLSGVWYEDDVLILRFLKPDIDLRLSMIFPRPSPAQLISQTSSYAAQHDVANLEKRSAGARLLLNEFFAKVALANQVAPQYPSPEKVSGVRPHREVTRFVSSNYVRAFWTMPHGEPEWITIPAGDFLMGVAGETYNFFLAEYRIARTPVTCAQYEIFVSSAGYPPPECWGDNRCPETKRDHPITGVGWNSAVMYCQWLSEKLGIEVTLPSEPEWEKAARGAEDDRAYPWGTKWDPSKCNCRQLGIGGTTPIGMFTHGTSPYGCLDMLGNVMEWTRSIYDIHEFPYPYKSDDGREEVFYREDHPMRPSGFPTYRFPLSSTDRVLKGSSFDEDGIEIGERSCQHAINFGTIIGFRICSK